MTMKNNLYGWVVVASLFFMYAISNGFTLNTLPLFYTAIGTDLGIDSEAIQRGPSLLFVLIAFMAPLMGRLLDKYSARLLITIGAVGLVADIFFFSFIKSYPQFITFYVIYAVFLALGGIISSVFLITRWFNKNRGKAIGIFLVSSSVGGAILNPLAGKWIKELGWHEAAMQLGFIAAAFLIIPLFFIRDNKSAVNVSGGYGSNHDVTLSQASRTPAFYLLLIATGVMWFCIYGIITNQPLYFADLKLDPAQSGKVIGTFFTFSILGKLIFGTLSDYFNKRNIMLLAIATLTIGSILLIQTANNQSLLMPYAICYGIGFSGVFTMIQLLVAELYQGRNYGSILGIVTMVDTLAGAAGAYVLGAMHKSQGNYSGAFMVMLVLCGIALVCTFLLRANK
jgi:MFS transporter, OFA family, oxalate/formate antiporter